MSQFDVYDNPIQAARRAFPLVAVLQADLANTGRERIVAPLAPRARLAVAGRLAPEVEVDRTTYVLIVPRLVPIAAADLRTPRGSVVAYRDRIVAALDYLFVGV